MKVSDETNKTWSHITMFFSRLIFAICKILSRIVWKMVLVQLKKMKEVFNWIIDKISLMNLYCLPLIHNLRSSIVHITFTTIRWLGKWAERNLGGNSVKVIWWTSSFVKHVGIMSGVEISLLMPIYYLNKLIHQTLFWLIWPNQPLIGLIS